MGRAKRNVVGVVKGAIGMQLSVVEIETEDRPAASATKCTGNRTKILIPEIKTSELPCDRLLQCSGSLSVAAENAKVFLVQNDGIRRD